MLVRIRAAQIALLALAIASCGRTAAATNGPFALSIGPGISTNLTASDAVRISRAYLDAQTPELAAPELHAPPQIMAVWAVHANDGIALDGCIPSGQGDRIVWITKGTGDYLNLVDHAWSKAASAELVCSGPGPAGTIVIDDASGSILGVYPENGAYPHPKQ